MKPNFPIISKFTDAELAAHLTSDDYFRCSGCEETDYLEDLVYIIDSQGYCFTYNQNERKIVPHHAILKIQKNDLVKILLDHITWSKFPSPQSGFFDNMTLHDIVMFASSIITKY
jgi:hypothetical protein